MASPQSVTSRYIRALLVEGKNDRYELVGVSRNINSVDNIPTGIYFTVSVCVPKENFREHVGIGATPEQALGRALQKDGVTLR